MPLAGAIVVILPVYESVVLSNDMVMFPLVVEIPSTEVAFEMVGSGVVLSVILCSTVMLGPLDATATTVVGKLPDIPSVVAATAAVVVDTLLYVVEMGVLIL